MTPEQIAEAQSRAKAFLKRIEEQKTDTTESNEITSSTPNETEEQIKLQVKAGDATDDFLFSHGLCSSPFVNSVFIQDVKADAKAGNAAAQSILGKMYADGIPQEFVKGNGIPQDYNEAVKWLTRAANQGSAEARKYLLEMNAKKKDH